MAIGALTLTAASAYAAISFGFWSAQKRLIFGRTSRVRTLQAGPFADQHELTPLRLKVAPKVSLEGWVARPRHGATDKVLIYFGGRNEHVAWAAQMGSHLGSWSVYAFNYRGMGESGGKPSESSAKSDALQILDEVRRIEGEAAPAPVVMGRSLGTAMAIWAATRRDVAQLVLLSPFDSVRSLLRQRTPLNWMSWLLHQHFDCMDDAGRVKAETIILLAANDNRVPHGNSLRLAAKFANLRHLGTVPGVTHNSLPRHPDTLALIGDLLNRKRGQVFQKGRDPRRTSRPRDSPKTSPSARANKASRTASSKRR
jgi:pimeloyl-ACP methyl ester carboxylesterase